MNDLLKLLPLMLRKAGDSPEVREQAVFAAWVAAVGEALRQVSTPLKLEKKTLIIAVKNTNWRTQMTRLRGQMLFKINSLLGSPLVTTLEFVVNPDKIKTVAAQASKEVEFIAPQAHALALQERASAIANPELRAAFLRAAGKCLDRRYR